MALPVALPVLLDAVALDTMPGYKSEGVEHSFLERFHAQEEAFNEE